MGKKVIKKRPNTGPETLDPWLEDVGEDRQFEIDEDEEQNLIVFVHHYRHKFGDGFDADMEHALNYEEANEVVGIMITLMERMKDRILKAAEKVKVVPEPKEGNPLQGPKNLDGA